MPAVAAIQNERTNERTNGGGPSTPEKATRESLGRVGIMELRTIPGLKLVPTSVLGWIALAGDVGLDVIREAAQRVLADGKPAWLDDVAPVASRIAAQRRADERAARPEPEVRAAEARRFATYAEREAAEKAKREVEKREFEARVTGANVEEGRAILAEFEASSLTVDDVGRNALTTLRAAIDARRVGDYILQGGRLAMKSAKAPRLAEPVS